MLISPDYRALNETLHATNAAYGSRGGKWARRIESIARDYDAGTVLDYGCGKAPVELRYPLRVSGYDPAVEAYAAAPEPADLVVCTDVLEHVEPEHLDAVLGHMAGLTLRAAFVVVGTRPSDKTLADGRNAHLIVERMEWWLVRMQRFFRLVAAWDSGEPGHWRDRGLKTPPLVGGREFSAVLEPL